MSQHGPAAELLRAAARAWAEGTGCISAMTGATIRSTGSSRRLSGWASRLHRRRRVAAISSAAPWPARSVSQAGKELSGASR